MSKHISFISSDVIISRFIRDTGSDEVSTSDLIEWIADAIRLIGVKDVFIQTVSFIEIKNNKGTLPKYLQSIIQVAKYNGNELKPIEVVCDTQEIDIQEIQDCPSCNSCSNICGEQEEQLCNQDLLRYNPYFSLYINYGDWCSCNHYSKYTPIRLANHTFFKTLVCEEDKKIYSKSCQDEYTLDNGNIITSFKEGFIAIAYNKMALDNKGLPLIPEDISIESAITNYLMWKYTTRLWYLGRQGYADKVKYFEEQWVWYCRQSKTNASMLYGIDEHENFSNMKNQLIPRNKRYNNFFKNLGSQENTDFKNR